MAWKNIQVKKSTRISVDNFRIQAVILEFEYCNLLLFNTYFPCDSQKAVLSNEETEKLQNLLSDISSIKEKYSKKYGTSIIAGDINFDDNRYTGHTAAINTFLEQHRLCSAWDSFPIDFTFSFGQAVSTIDHFFISNSNLNILLEEGVLHDPENLSGHSPIYIKIDLVKASNPLEKMSKPPRLDWGRSSTDQHAKYTQQLYDQLALHEPQPCLLECQDVLCSNTLHTQHIDSMTKDLLTAMVDSAWDNLESTKGNTGDQASREFTIPGWNESVKPFQNEARF